MRALVTAGADVNAVEPIFGAVPLHKATYNGYLEITRILAEAPNVNLNYQGPRMDTPRYTTPSGMALLTAPKVSSTRNECS